MLQYIKFFHEIYNGITDDKRKIELLRIVIRTEAQINNDIAAIISKSDPKKLALSAPKIYEQFDTSSFELLSALGVSSFEVLGDDRLPKEEDLSALDKSSNSLEYFSNRTRSELYEFYIRKTRLLSKLAQSGSICSVNVGLTTRVRNVEYATRFLARKLS